MAQLRIKVCIILILIYFKNYELKWRNDMTKTETIPFSIFQAKRNLGWFDGKQWLKQTNYKAL